MRHQHEHEHGTTTRDVTRQRPLQIALAITILFLIAEVVGALLSGSLALLADAAHMFTDVAALALALFAFWVSRWPATPVRTYGHYRVEVLAALVNATALLVVVLFIFWEAYQRLRVPPTIDALPMLGVATLGLVANGLSAWVLSRGETTNLNLRGALLHVLADALGSVGVIVAGVVILLTGWTIADPIAAMLIGVLVLWASVGLLRESVDVLMEAVPRGVDLLEVEATLQSLRGVAGVHDLHVWTVTSGFLALSGHLTLREERDPREPDLLLQATDLLRDRFGITHVTLQVEGPRLEGELHHGCYVGPDVTVCSTIPRRE